MSELTATDTARKDRWHRVIRLKRAAVTRGNKIRVGNALEGDAPELVRARYWQRAANCAGAESFYLANLAAETAAEGRSALDAGNTAEGERCYREAREIRAQAAAAQQRYEVAGHYDAEALRQVILCELREKLSDTARTSQQLTASSSQLVALDLRRAEKKAREAQHSSTRAHTSQKLSSAPANAPGQSSLKQVMEGALAIT
jgi:hypothetical protein